MQDIVDLYQCAHCKTYFVRGVMKGGVCKECRFDIHDNIRYGALRLEVTSKSRYDDFEWYDDYFGYYVYSPNNRPISKTSPTFTERIAMLSAEETFDLNRECSIHHEYRFIKDAFDEYRQSR